MWIRIGLALLVGIVAIITQLEADYVSNWFIGSCYVDPPDTLTCRYFRFTAHGVQLHVRTDIHLDRAWRPNEIV